MRRNISSETKDRLSTEPSAVGLGDHLVEPTSTKIPTRAMEILPREILQCISWFALNPELYLVCKPINSRLPPLSDFQVDVGLLLLADRIGSESAWGDVVSFPWQTPEAAKCDYSLNSDERAKLQKEIFNQAWFTIEKFKHIAAGVSKLWVEKHWDLAHTEDAADLHKYLEKRVIGGPPATFFDDHGNKLSCMGYGYFSIRDADLRRRAVDVQSLPLKVFLGPGSPMKTHFLNVLERCGRSPTYPTSAVRESVLSAALTATLDWEENWFLELFGFALQRGVTVPRSQLFWEVYSLMIRERNWITLKLICREIFLPEGFFESKLEPELNKAIADGDLGARELLRWIHDKGWDDIQSCANADTEDVFRDEV